MGETHFQSTLVCESGFRCDTNLQVGSESTRKIAAIEAYTVQFTEPDLAASTHIESTYTVVGATTNATYVFTPRLLLESGYTIGSVRCSSSDEVSILWVDNTLSTNSGSSNRGTLLQISY